MSTSRFNLAPVSRAARRDVERRLRRRASDREIVSMFRGCECRDIPEKLAVLDALMMAAWSAVHALTGSGVRFAGNSQEAALVIAGTAYAGWRSSIHGAGRREPGAAARVAWAIADGIEFAMHHKEGIPAMYAKDFAAAVAGSDDPVDGIAPLAALARLWPDRYMSRAIRFRRPKYETSADGGRADQFLGASPNVLTASPSRSKARRAARVK